MTPVASTQEFSAGTLVGNYRIEGVLGRGGMGVVYRATDTKLQRPVAIKFLMEFLSAALADPNARRRFEQEAQTASSLNHPHIVTVYDVGEHDGRKYLVSELVDGGTLAEWLGTRRPRMWRQSIELLTGIADAIGAAHAAGVVHRDIKPGNILLGRNGYAKLADFGLAKLLEPRSGDATQAASRLANTTTGAVIGTVAYMSPEQASGLPVDARSDVFSFGVVLYEALAGLRPFTGASDLEVLQAIAHAAPPPLPAEIPAAIHGIVEKALEKDPAERYQHMQDLVVDLRRALRKAVTSPTRSARDGAGARRAGWLVAATLAVAALAAIPATRIWWRAPAVAVQYELPAVGFADELTISPDGMHLAFVANVNGARQIAVQPIGAVEARTLPGTNDPRGLIWSPDSRSLAFSSDNSGLRRVALDTGAVQPIGPIAASAPLGAWGRDGTLLISARTGEESGVGTITRVAVAGGNAERVTTLGADILHILPQLLPDGRHFLYVSVAPSTAGAGASTLTAGALASSLAKPLLSLGTSGPGNSVQFAYHDGTVLYLRTDDRTLTAQAFDVASLELEGEPVPIAGNVRTFAISDTGTLVYVDMLRSGSATVANAARQLSWYDRSGERVGILAAPADAANARLSPDGRRVSFSGAPSSMTSEIWITDVAEGAPTRLTFAPRNFVPLWSRDGSRIAFVSTRSNAMATNEIYWKAANGAGSDELLFAGATDELLVPSDWSPDGQQLLFQRQTRRNIGFVSDIWQLPLSGDRKPYPLLESATLKGGARLSPDGRWLAYSTNETGAREIVVRPYPNVSEGQWQVSTGGGLEPKWRGDGRELFYLGPGGSIMAVEITPGDTFAHGPARQLFDTAVVVPAVPAEWLYDATADGQRFLVNEPQARAAAGADGSLAAAATPVTVIVNWAAAFRVAARQ